ncbi:MAG: hypothetical protein AAGA80_15010 [Cyanobacteria bacterium P01_F01_bin.143]
MRYSLQERFLGAYLGSLIGEKLSIGIIETKPVPWLKIHQDIITQIPLSAGQSLSWENLTINITENNSLSEIALAILPIILYYHDNLTQLELLLHRTVQHWQIPLSNMDGILWWSAAISLILREKLTPENLWEQLILTSKIFTHSFEDNSASWQLLFDRGLSISEIIEELSLVAASEMLPFLLSLYCFYQTPENFALTIKQASTVKNRVSNILALTGFLSGAYNVRYTFPVNWRKFCQNGNDYKKTWQLGRNVFALWSGVYMPKNNVNISAIIATPRTLQNRSSLTIISQSDYESK